VLLLAQSVSVGFYAIGFGEALANVTGDGRTHFVQAVAAAAVLTLFVVAWLGANWATRFQFVIMTVLFVAIAGFFVGGLGAWDGQLLRENLAPSSDHGFWIIFAVFFPAVTGFTQGVSMSGDLKNPGRSLPRGTFLAVGVSLVIYVAAAVVFAAALPGGTLVGDYGAMRRVAPWPALVDAGVIAATLSSALASFLGAPRILQSLAVDRVFPFLRPFAVGHGPSANPRRGVLLDWEGLNHVEKTGTAGGEASRLRLALRYGCNLVLLAAGPGDLERVEEAKPRDRRIDVWHRDDATGRLMLLLAYLMTRTETWKDASIRVVGLADPEVGPEATRDKIERLLREGRIPAEAIAVDACDEATLVRQSGDASMIFLPLRISDGGASLAVGETPIDGLASEFPATALVLAAQDISLDPEPEDGEHGTIARAVDEARDAERSAKAAEQKAAKAEARATAARGKLAAAQPGLEPDERAKLEQAVAEAAREAEDTKRRAARGRAKADDATREAAELTGNPEPTADDAEDPAGG